jgi:hypothetical protein
MVLVHRFSYETYKGPIPEGLNVNHEQCCLNRHCVNPKHLYVGTQEENVHDCIEMGRKRIGDQSGESNNSAKLTWKVVREIRERYAMGGTTQDELALMYKVCRANISFIISNKRWKE